MCQYLVELDLPQSPVPQFFLVILTRLFFYMNFSIRQDLEKYFGISIRIALHLHIYLGRTDKFITLSHPFQDTKILTIE